MSYKQFRSDLAKEMKNLHDERLEQLIKLDSLSISEKLKKEAREQIFVEFNKKIEEIKNRPGYLEAREAHIAEIKKEYFHKQYERAVIDVMVKEKLFENMGRTAETEEVKRLGNFEIPEFETRGRGNSKENISRVMFILDSLSDDALNDMAYEFYKKGWILLLLKNVKFKILQKDFFNWAKKNNIKLEVNFTEWRRMVDKKDSLLTPVNEKKLLGPFNSFLTEFFLKKVEDDGGEGGSDDGGEGGSDNGGEGGSDDGGEGGSDNGEEGEQPLNMVGEVDEASEDGEFVEVKIGEYSVKIMKSKHRLSDGACFRKVKQCIEDKIKKMGIEYDPKIIKNLPSTIFGKVKSIVYNGINVKEWDFYSEGISNLIKNNEIIIDVVLGIINSQSESIQTNKKKAKEVKI